MNARKVSPPMAATLVLLASVAAAQLASTPPTCQLTVTPVNSRCVKDSTGQPIYSWQIQATDNLSCGLGGTLQVVPATAALPNSFPIATPGPTRFSLATFNGTTALTFSLNTTACGQCGALPMALPLPSNCDLCMKAPDLQQPPVCTWVSGNTCRYQLSFNVSDNTDVPGVVQFPGANVSPARVNVTPGTNAVTETLTAPCDTTSTDLTVQLSLGGASALQVCAARLDVPLQSCAPPPCSPSVTPVQKCVLDSLGQPIYTWTLNVTDALSCSGGGTLIVSPATVPSMFSVATPGTTAVSMVSFNPVSSLDISLSGCGQVCPTNVHLTPATSCGQCMDLSPPSPTCSGASGSQCTYTLVEQVTNNTGVASPVQFSVPTGSVSPVMATIPPGVTTLPLTLQAPCGASEVLVAKLFPGDANAPKSCEKEQQFQLKGCGCIFEAVPQAASLCASDSTQVDLQPLPRVPAGAITWSSTTNCSPPGPPWTTLSGGSSWYTLGLNQTTCYRASIQGLDGCPSPVLSTVGQVQVTTPAPAGPLQCKLQATGEACAPQMCAPVKLSLQAPPDPPGCTRTWVQNLGSGWQAVSGVTGSEYSPPPLTTATGCSSPAKLRTTVSCASCGPSLAEEDFEIFEPSVAGMLTPVKPQICAGGDDVVNWNGPCPTAAIQWQISTDGSSWNDINGALGQAWLTNKLFQNTWYRVKVTNGPCAAVYSPPAPITVTPEPTVTISNGGPTQFCSPGSVVLTATATGGPGKFQWFKDGLPFENNTPSVTVAQSGNYWVVFATDCGKAESNKIKVFVSKVVAAISAPSGACPPQHISLHGLGTGGLPDYTYSWSWDNHNPLEGQELDQNLTEPTTYTLKVKDSLNCPTTVTQKVGICPKLKANAGNNQTIQQGRTTALLGGTTDPGGTPTATGGQIPYTYSWTPTKGLNDPRLANPVAAPTETTTYTVTATDAKGCKAKAQVRVTVSRPTAPTAAPSTFPDR